MIRLHFGLPDRNVVACLLPPVIAALLSCVFITVRPIADLSGSFAFLVSTLQFLYFYPAGTLSTLIESSGESYIASLANDSMLCMLKLVDRSSSSVFPWSCRSPGLLGPRSLLCHPLQSALVASRECRRRDDRS
jgi:hypothetical protein